ncbi:MAG: hypothetical protein K5755_06055 [Clostridiales bacterium]|nr:hypothetical protein [Clostridia bacterium]MCR4564180.1 hypothetical protein [Clostridiales bacterium]
MDDISSLLSSISPEEMEQIKDVASSLMPSQGAPAAQLPSGFTRIMQNINSRDEKTELIKALKPFLSAEKQQRADEAVRLLKLMKILPLLKELNINDLPV